MTNISDTGVDDQSALHSNGEASDKELSIDGGYSTDREIRITLRNELVSMERPKNIVEVIREVFGPQGGVVIDLPPRVKEY